LQNKSPRACPELVERGRLNFRPVQIRFERCLGSAPALSVQRPSPFCHPERSERICGAPFVCPAPTGPQPPPTSPNPHENTNLRFVIPGFQEWSAEPQIPRLRSPGFPVEIGGVGKLHAPFLTRKAHSNRVQRSVAGNPGRDDKKERVVARKEWLLNRGIFQIYFGQLLADLSKVDFSVGRGINAKQAEGKSVSARRARV
jgi:hypothetical protein